ncbi:DUF3105 domain-containing protein [Nocardioides marmotae]|uniref:DUF3105 domain-containing protein n=1 Tax=Nocardioides marmotae TaxID=2663857 RepID=UPI0012B52030|nr:DUF3105 domain-containing protein [Nocardioides marmotae]MBC9731917.1 DUF3105 domain-containing protein [Nocardioides marmotae]MTB83037.1 DUF3105 domain-containing protein [Nocardioides marmotae]
MGPPTDPPAGPPSPQRDRFTVVALASIAVAALLLVAVGVPVAVGQMRSEEAADVERDLSEVVAVEDLSTEHTTGDVTYPHTPPIGGPHHPRWLDCGVYDEPVREENVVHDLEHGTVWITYDPDLSADDVAALAEQLPANGILSPYPDLPAPVVVTVWGRQLRLVGADDPRLGLFVETFGGGETAPEPFASCAGGVPDPQGGEGTGTEGATV